jgi:hypothetical protein
MNEYDEGMEGTDLLKDLRRQLKEQSAKNKELEQELTGIRTEKRQTSMSTKLAESGYPADVAKFVPDDMELDQLDHWLEEHGSLFQRSAEAVEAEEAEKPQPQEVAEAARINSLADASIPVDKLQDFERQIGEAQSDEQVQQIINEAKKFVL